MENITIQERAVAVKQVPGKLGAKRRRIFFRDLQSSMEIDRPRMVLDCSNVLLLDSAVIELLLGCLEEALKRNGDIKLAALPPGASETLDFTGASRLFDIYKTTAEAVKSFDQLPSGKVSQSPMHSHREPGNAS